MRYHQTLKALARLKAVAGIVMSGVELAAVVGTAVYWSPPRFHDRPNPHPWVK
jgi:hypothetical protein